MKILKELNEVTKEDDTLHLMEAIYSAIDEVTGHVIEEGRSHADKIRSKRDSNFKKFFNSNKELVKDASVIAVSNYADWNKNSRKTITLHAKDAHERRTIGNIVNALTKSKKFRIHKNKFHMGRKIWILKKV